MKVLTALIITIALAAPLLAQELAPVQGGVAQARQELNEAAEAYRNRNFAEALKCRERFNKG